MTPTDTDTNAGSLLSDAGGARPRDELDELDGLIERLRSVSCILTPECDEHKTVREAAAAIVQLRDALRDMTADRDSWEQQNDDRVSDVLEQANRAERAEQRIKELEAQIGNRS